MFDNSTPGKAYSHNLCVDRGSCGRFGGLIHGSRPGLRDWELAEVANAEAAVLGPFPKHGIWAQDGVGMWLLGWFCGLVHQFLLV